MSRALWRVLDPLPLHAMAIDRRDRLIWLNAATATAHGLVPDDVIGLNVHDIWSIAHEHATQRFAAIRRAELSRELVHMETPDGPRWLDTTWQPIGAGVLVTCAVVTAAVRLRAMDLALSPQCPPKLARTVLMLDRLPPLLKQRVATRLAG